MSKLESKQREASLPESGALAIPEPLLPRLADRVRAGLWILLVIGLVFVPFDYLRLHGSVPAVHLAQALLLTVTVSALAITPKLHEEQVKWLGVTMLIVGCLASATIGVLSRDTQATALLSIASILAASTTLPWGVAPQATAAVFVTAIYLGSSLLVHGGPDFFAAPERAAFVLVMAASIWIAGAMERERRGRILSEADRTNLLRRVHDEAQVSANLAALSQRLLSAPDPQGVYEILCRHCVESLQCDSAYVWLRNEKERSYHAVAQFGDRQETWQMTRTVKLEELGDYAKRLTDAHVVVATGEEIRDLPRGEWALSLGLTRIVHIALQRQGKLFGSIACSFTQPAYVWTESRQRLTEGIWRTASLAIENAHLIEALARASRVKSDFLSTMSHELRTPLNVIIGYNDLLLDEAFGPTTGEQRDTLRRVQRHSKALLTLINQTLDVGRIEAGTLTVEEEAIEVADLLRELDADTRELQDKPGLTVRWQTDPDLPMLFSDSAKLKITLRNLLHNAIKFTDRGEVAIRASPCEGGIEISVRDSGVGIPADALDLIFDAFQQIDDTGGRSMGGVGLGLYIARRFVEALGGTLGVESQEGVGSTFRLRLPRRPRRGSPETTTAQTPP